MPWSDKPNISRLYWKRLTAIEVAEAHNDVVSHADEDNSSPEYWQDECHPVSDQVPPKVCSLNDFLVEGTERKRENEASSRLFPISQRNHQEQGVTRKQTTDEVYRAIPLGATQRIDSNEDAKQEMVAMPTKNRNPQEYCGNWHASSVFVEHYFLVEMDKDNRRFRIVLRQQLDEINSLSVEESFGKNRCLPYPNSLLAKSVQMCGFIQSNTLDRYDIFEEWIACRPMKTYVPTTTQSDTPSNVLNACIVCFEGCGENYIPSQCGHVVCKDCWQSYLDVTCRNADRVRLFCPAENCPAVLDLLEASFLIEKDTDLWTRLVRTEMDWFATRHCQGFYCPNRYCSALLVLEKSPSLGEPSSNGSHVIMCHKCCQLVCTHCRKPAHPGMDCAKATRMEKVLARMDEAALNLTFITKYTKPCPKCSYAITKVDGCNHMRCNHCQYYFCWMCGGYGNDCNAYTCSNPADKDWWKRDSDIPSAIKSIENDADRYKSHLRDLSNYRATERTMISLKRLLHHATDSNEANAQLVLDALQIQEIIVMARRWKLFYQESNKYNKCRKIDDLLNDLDALATEYAERLGQKHHKHLRSSRPTRHLKKLREAAAETKADVASFESEREFQTLVRQVEQPEMTKMETKQLHQTLSLKTTRRTLAFLLQPKQQHRLKKKGKTVDKDEGGVTLTIKENDSPDTSLKTEPLNERMKRTKHGWQVADGEVNTNEFMCAVSTETVLPWKKTKARINRQRRHDLAKGS